MFLSSKPEVICEYVRLPDYSDYLYPTTESIIPPSNYFDSVVFFFWVFRRKDGLEFYESSYYNELLPKSGLLTLSTFMLESRLIFL